MASCANHPDRKAVLRCVKCNKWFCEACAEGPEGNAYCFGCLKEIALKTKQVKYGSTSLPNVLGAALSAALGLVLLYEDVSYFNFPAISLSMSALKAFASTPGAQVMGIALAAMMLYFVLSIGIIANRKWSFYVGMLLIAAVFYWKATELLGDVRGPKGTVLVGEAVTLGLLSAVLIASRKKLTA